MFRNLRELIAVLRRESEIVEIEAPVDPRLELAEVHRRVIAADGPALFFKSVKSARFPVVTNLFGTRRRVEIAFGDGPRRIVARVAELAETLLPPTLGKIWGARAVARALARARTKSVRRGPVTEIVARDFSLGSLPVLTCWPEDGGPFITLPLVYTEHPQGGGHNLGIYRLQRYDDRRLGMHWQIAKGGGFHFHEAEAAGAALPVTIFLGGSPALLLAAVAPLPENIGELALAALVQEARLARTTSPLGPHPLIAEAEFALAGSVPPGVRAPEGPFGDHYGYYSLRHDYPVFHLEAASHRRDAIYPATVVGKPRQEDFYLGDFLQEMLSPLFPLVMPGVKSLWSYGETGYHSLAAAVVRERYPREAMVSAFRILGEGQLSLTKFLLVTDAVRDLRDFRGLLAHLLERARWERDLFLFGGLSMDTLDYTGPRVNEGSKGVLLGMGAAIRSLPQRFDGSLPHGVARVLVYCPGCLVVEAPAYRSEREAPARLAREPAFADWQLLVCVDDAKVTAASDARFLWSVFTRFEPAADVFGREVALVQNHPAFQAPIAIDARLKPSYPRELFCDPDTAKTVSERWREYFPNGVAMGDSDRAHLG
ncbi:MAG: UbiD family decarboxylase [Planctomycetes bacterium]|nr:UbiD family decarboxylase [Planctomycetota bacterium]